MGGTRREEDPSYRWRSLKGQAGSKSNGEANGRGESIDGNASHGSAATGITSAGRIAASVGALVLARGLRNLARAGNGVLDLADSIVLDAVSLALGAAERLGVFGEADIGTVVKSVALLTAGDDLDGGLLAFLDVEVDGEGGDAERAVTGGVPELRGEGDVEVGLVEAEAEVDEDVSPRVVELELDAAAGEGPVGYVANVTGNTSAFRTNPMLAMRWST